MAALASGSEFLDSNFEPNVYAHSIVESGDVNSSLAKLNFSVDNTNRELKSLIKEHHSELLLQAASLGGLGEDLVEVKRGLAEVENGFWRLQRKISVPYTSLESSLTLLTKLRRASSLARRASRFTILTRRLSGQMELVDNDSSSHLRSSISSSIGENGMSSYSRGSISGEEMRARGSIGGDGINLRASISGESGGLEGRGDGRGTGRRERAMAEAALTLAEIESLLEIVQEEEDDSEATLPIRDLDAVAIHIPVVEASRERVVTEMESMVNQGLETLDNPLLASSLQTAHNLSVLPSLVEALVQELLDNLNRKIKLTFDMTTLSREMGGKETTSGTSAFVYKSRARNEPTASTVQQWTIAMWTRLESLVEDLGIFCIKIYTLEKVLLLKRDQNTQSTFLEESMTVLENKPSVIFWTTLSQSLESQARESAKASSFIFTLFSSSYPRFLRLFQEFFDKIASETGTVYSKTIQSPESILILRAILPFETLYLSRSTNRLSELVSSAFSISSSNSLAASFSTRSLITPGSNEGIGLARAIVNELDAARFDLLLGRAVARGAGRAIDMFISRIEGLISTDHNSLSLLGPIATPSQTTNAELTSSVFHLHSVLSKGIVSLESSILEIIKIYIERLEKLYLSIINPLIQVIRRELSNIITKLHRVDFSSNVSTTSRNSYMIELGDKMTLVRDEIFGAYKVGELIKEWILDLARFIVQTFVLHASIISPLSEAGKLKLVTDTTSLEFSISQFLSSHSLSLSIMGDQHKALRAFRPLLFLSDEELSDRTKTVDVPILILIHHLIGRSQLQFPHRKSSWTEGEYVRWLNEHGEEERIRFVEGVLVDAKEEDEPFVKILKEILKRQEEN